MKTNQNIYGVLAEFSDPAALIRAAQAARAHGYRKLDAFSPFPVEGLSEAIGFTKTRMSLVVLIGGIGGALGGYFLQYWALVKSYPLNVGGRPLHSWPAFIPVTFETTILCAALAAVLGLLAMNGLPQPYHPLFNVERFSAASRDGFFLCVEAGDPLFEEKNPHEFFRNAGAKEIHDVDF